MKNFNLRSFLTENKLTQNTKQIQEVAKPVMKVSELRALVKELLDETSLNEALNKPLKEFGPDLKKRLETLGFKVGLFPQKQDFDNAVLDRLKNDTSLVAIAYFNGGKMGSEDIEYETINVLTNSKNQQKLEKAVDYFNLTDSAFGPEKDAGFVVKQAINKNDGDILASKVVSSGDFANVKFNRFIQGNYKNVKTTDKMTGKTDLFKQAAE